MKKRNIKLFAVSVIALLVAGGGIFYACNKEEQYGNTKKSLNKNLNQEAEFITQNYDEACVQVYVFRDENNNAQFTIKDIGRDPEQTVGLMVSKELNLKPLTDKEEYTLEIPNDGIYWLVPLDGNEPIKFEPGNDEKGLPGSSQGAIQLLCSCWEWKPGNYSCQVERDNANGKEFCGIRGTCKKCQASQIVQTGSFETTFVGSTYLVKSNIITVNGITYK